MSLIHNMPVRHWTPRPVDARWQIDPADTSHVLESDESCIAIPAIKVFRCGKNGEDLELEFWSRLNIEGVRELKWERPI